MGARRSFASAAAKSMTASLSGASVMRTTIQLMSGGGRSEPVRKTATGHCAFSASSVAVEPTIERA